MENTQARGKVYATEEAAVRRVERLNQEGMWPGIVRCAGGWHLTHDPDDYHGHGHGHARAPGTSAVVTRDPTDRSD